MKAQLSIEIILTMIIFISFVSYFFFQLIISTPSYIRELKRETLSSEAYQVSELLVNDEGKPNNWYIDGTFQRVGLSDETKKKTNLLSILKISKLQEICRESNGYDKVKSGIDTSFDFHLLLLERTPDATANPLVDCKPTMSASSATNLTVRRVVAFGENRYGELILQMW